ncbi:aminotransferase class IV family protein [Amycolatopsis sp. NPDC051903]|uniref:aminotransferase class IV family protein n=1 Tax=Amycolatopsis sp. NPDC051903 TaxID=3363936 RepID=UPI0037ADA70C
MELNGSKATLDQLKSLALTNYGHFTSMLVEDGCVRGLSLHLQRLSRDCHLLFDVNLDTDRLREFVVHALAGEDSKRIVARVTVYDPHLDLGTIGSEAEPSVLVTTRPAADGVAPPLRLQAASYRREKPSVKHIGLFGALDLRRSAQREGFDDVLFLNADGTISEIATSNIGFVRDGEVVWPRSEQLAGVTMSLLHRASDEAVTTEPLTLSDLGSMEGAFATNAATGIRAVAAVDDIAWPTEHKLLTSLRDLYLDIPAERL